jgi:hypothetical protein
MSAIQERDLSSPGEITRGVPTGGGLAKAHGVASAPQLMRAHQTGSVTRENHTAIHTGGPESEGSTMPVVARPNDKPSPFHGTHIYLGKPSPIGVVAAPANLRGQGKR